MVQKDVQSKLSSACGVIVHLCPVPDTADELA